MIHLAIVGIGWAGTRQAQAIQELRSAGRDRFVIECLVDNDPEFLRAKASELGVVKTYARLEDALRDSGVTAVSICTPHTLHCPQALEALSASKHVLVEKPMAMNVDDATRMINAAKRHGVKVYVAENLAYAPMTRFLSAFLRGQDASPVGDIAFAVVANGFRAPNFGYEGRRAWLTQPDLGGTGTWMLHGVHSMAQLRQALGEVSIVYLREHKTRSYVPRDIEGTLAGTLVMRDGFCVNITQTSEVRFPHLLGGYVVHGDRASVHAGKHACEVFGLDADEPERLEYETGISEYAREMEAFADHAEGIAPGPTDGISERRSLAIVLAGYESMRAGAPIDLREMFGEL